MVGAFAVLGTCAAILRRDEGARMRVVTREWREPVACCLPPRRGNWGGRW
jgi:hypothetical protein